MSDRNFDRRGKIWHKSRRKRKTGWSSKSDNPLERKETHAIGLRAAGKLGLFASKPVRASEPSSAIGVAAGPEKRTGEARSCEESLSKGGGEGARE